MYKRNNSSKNKKDFDKKIKINLKKKKLIQQEPERYSFAVEWWAGCPVCCVCVLFSKVFVVLLLSFVFVVVA